MHRAGDRMGARSESGPGHGTPARPPNTGVSLLAIIVVIVGLAATAAGFGLSRRWERERWEGRFRIAALERVSAVQREIERQLEVLHSLRGLFHSSNFVDAGEFERFAEQALKRHRGLASLAYAPRITASHREAAEQTLGVPITEMDQTGVRRPAAQRDEYYPIWYAKGQLGINPPVGFDLYSEPERAAALHDATQTGRLSTTAPLRLVPPIESTRGVLAFLPVAGGGVGDTDNGQDVEGVVVSLLAVERLVEEAVASLPPPRMDLEIYDPGDPDDPLLRIRADGRPAADLPPLDAENVGSSRRPVVRTEMIVGGRRWVILAGAAESARDGWGPWALLAAGLMVTTLLATNISTSVSRREARRLVEERTRDLRAEIERHKRARAALAESELRFRQMADNIDSVFWLTDQGGRRLEYVSAAYERIWGRSADDIRADRSRFLETVHPEDRHRIAALLDPAARGNICIEYRIIRPDGSIRWIRDRAFQVPSENGAPPRTAGIAEDITEQKLADEAARRSSERLRQVFSAVVDPIWDQDFTTGATVHSPGWATLLGYGPDEAHLASEPWETLVHPDDRQRVWAAIHACLEGLTDRYEAEYRLRTRSGEWKWVLSRGRIVERDAAGRGTRMIGSTTEITDRKRVEDALRESEARQRAVLQAVPDSMFRMRRDGTYVDYHAPEGALLLLPPEEFLGRRCGDVLPAHLARPCERAIIDALDTGHVQTYSYTAGPPEDPRHWEVRVAPCGDDEVLLIVRDVTEQRRAVDAVRASEAKYRLIVETAHEGVWATDRDGRTTFVNARMAEMLGYSPDEMIGRHMHEFMDEAARAAADRHLERRRRGLREEHDLCLRRRDGTPLWTLFSTGPIRDDAGQFAGAISMVTDITARKAAEEELRRQEARYRAVVEGQAELVCRYTPQGEITFANDAFCRFFDKKRSEVVGRALSAVGGDRGGERLMAALCAPGAEPTGPRAQTELTDAQGRRRWIAWSRKAIADIGGRAIEIQAVGRDVTDAKLAEEALRRSEELNRRLLEALPGGLVVVGADGLFRRINPVAAEFLGLPVHTLERMTAADFAAVTLREDGSPMPADEYPVTECFATGRPAGPTTIGVRRPDGTVAWGVFRAVPLPGPDGAGLDAAAVMFLDITERRRFEEALRAGEERYRVVAEQTGQLIYDYDIENGRIVWVGAIEPVSGYTPEQFAEVTIERWAELIHPDDRAHVVAELDRARAAGDHFRVEYRFRRADGSYADILDNGVFLRGPGGEPRRMLGTMQDVTELRRREAALAESEARYRLLAENATDMISRHTPEGVYTYASPACRALLGYEPEELIGRNAFDLFEPDEVQPLQQTRDAILGSPTPEVVRYRIRRKDGRLIWLETTARTVRDDSGAVREIVAVSRDITARMKADRELRTSEEKFRSLSTCSPVGIFMSAPDGQLTWVNPRLQEIGGFTFDEAMGDGWMRNIHPDDREWLVELWRSAISAASPFAAEARFQHPDGAIRWVRAAAAPMFSDAGELIGHVGAVEDVTDRRLAERALRDSEERYRRLVESFPDGICVHQDGRFVFFNEAGLRLFGAASPADMIGRPIWDIIDESTRPITQERLRRLREGATALPAADAKLVRLDGSTFDAEIAVSVCNYEGKPAVQAVIRDITARKATEQRLRFQASVLSQVDDAVVAVDRDGNITYLNAAAARAYGVDAADVLRHPIEELFTTQWLHPQDQAQATDALRRHGRWEGLSVHVKRSGERVYVESAVSILRDEQGREAGTLSVLRDVTERIRSEQRQNLMMAELDHRVKNNLAAVLSIADHTVRSSSSLKEFSVAFEGRVRALARMHGVLARSRWQGANLQELARQTLSPYGPRIAIEGPDVLLPARAASPIAMALHELATNAAKYGALSAPTGQVSVNWSFERRDPAQSDGAPALLRLRWAESGGPTVIEPERRGFGTELIEGGIAYELRGNVAITFRPEGLVCEMAIPLEPEHDRLTPPPPPPATPASPPQAAGRANATPSTRRTRRDVSP